MTFRFEALVGRPGTWLANPDLHPTREAAEASALAVLRQGHEELRTVRVVDDEGYLVSFHCGSCQVFHERACPRG